MNTKSLKQSLMAVRLAIWELHLYLSTNPDDCDAKCLMKEYTEKYYALLDEYECRYGALTAKPDNDCTWSTVPFPWVNCGGDS